MPSDLPPGDDGSVTGRNVPVFAPGSEGPPPDLFADVVDARGTYTLVLTLAEPAAIDVGALGARSFPAGGYAYTGSAFGTGGLVRVDRHRRLAGGDHDARHWHVDYLTGHPGTDLAAVVLSPGVDVECAVARALSDDGTRSDHADGGDGAGTGNRHRDRDGPPIEGFGASDCDCRTHLAYRPSTEAMLEAAKLAHRRR